MGWGVKKPFLLSLPSSGWEFYRQVGEPEAHMSGEFWLGASERMEHRLLFEVLSLYDT